MLLLILLLLSPLGLSDSSIPSSTILAFIQIQFLNLYFDIVLLYYPVYHEINLLPGRTVGGNLLDHCSELNFIVLVPGMKRKNTAPLFQLTGLGNYQSGSYLKLWKTEFCQCSPYCLTFVPLTLSVNWVFLFSFMS